MPSRIVTEAACKLAKDSNAAIITSVFQTDTLLSDGACRAITSVWVGALITMDGTLKTLREKLDTSTSGKLHEEYGKLQDLQLDFVDEFLELSKTQSNLEGTLALYKQLQSQLPMLDLQSRADGDAARETLAALSGKVMSLVGEARVKSARRWALVASNQKRDAYDMTAENVALDAVYRDPASVFTINGVYYIGVPGHVVGMLYRRTGERLFIDANTGEWVLPQSVDVGAFLARYFSEIYKGKYTTIDTLVGFRRDEATALHKPARPCPYGKCPFGGTFTLACDHNDL